MKVLITGVKGFTGKYVSEFFSSKGWEVFGCGTQSVDSDPNYYQINLLDMASVSKLVENIKPDYVVHLAAKAFVADSDVDSFYSVNICGTRNLLQALSQRSFPLKKLLIASSANVYGNIYRSGPIQENAQPEPANDYAISKLSMEYVVNLWQDKVPVVMSRPFNYTGRGQNKRFVVPKIVNAFREKSEIVELGNIDVERDFSDVRDVARIYFELLTSPTSQLIYNVCSGHSYSLHHVIQNLTELTGHEIRVKVNPDFVRASEVKVLVGDPSLLENQIGSVEITPFSETLSWMVRE
ncbi:GDP-mannose 4,6-dehydratase [Sessilibacter corallicola]|uniref:GDP-mannose 4,6-dehydratase n=1 Tax=Sessilibacter corallicola TaxID=2904075 RepID=UPI001E39FFE0|nr:GDP-mannose 4,6-dehydratase [Sessilibacter corallicola]MCE2028982.1 GDP-mannose 4,6-dehydratase [Sessilibacter corallicola]